MSDEKYCTVNSYYLYEKKENDNNFRYGWNWITWKKMPTIKQSNQHLNEILMIWIVTYEWLHTKQIKFNVFFIDVFVKVAIIWDIYEYMWIYRNFVFFIIHFEQKCLISFYDFVLIEATWN